MSADEAFIRAIVDNPGDDTPRLVYADWLDDRDDPRGPYLRAEHEWAATHDPADRDALARMAKALDPVWVARVSRPPVGVCIEVGQLADCRPVSEADIGAAEDRLQITFPADYRAFLLNYNPRLIRREWYLVYGETVYANDDLTFYPLVSGLIPDANTLVHQAEDYQRLADDPRTYANGVREPRVAAAFLRYIPISCSAWDGDWVLLGVRDPEIGFINRFHTENSFSGQYSDERPWPRHCSFSEFLHNYLLNALGEFVVPDQERDDLHEWSPPAVFHPGTPPNGDNIPF